jgi:hypothetical protein
MAAVDTKRTNSADVMMYVVRDRPKSHVEAVTTAFDPKLAFRPLYAVFRRRSDPPPVVRKKGCGYE